MSKHFLPLEHDTNRRTGRKDKGGAKTDVRLRMTECIGAPKSRGLRFVLVEGKAVCRDRALVRRDRAVLPAASPVAVAGEEWLGQEPEGPVVFNSEKR